MKAQGDDVERRIGADGGRDVHGSVSARVRVAVVGALIRVEQ